MELQVGVKVFLKNKLNQVLLLKRSTKYDSIEGSWDIVGGRIKAGTYLLENLKREVLEETGLSVMNLPELLFAQDILRKDKHVVRLTYVTSTEGDPVINEEHTDLQWIDFEKIVFVKNLDEFTAEIMNNQELVSRITAYGA